MKKGLLFILLTIFTTHVSCKGKSNIDYSLYSGFGLGTNLGGPFGVGAEAIYNKHYSANFALGFDGYGVGDDIGLKLYPIDYFYLEINYGIVDYSYTPGNYSVVDAVSLTMGLKTPSYKEKIYLSGYIRNHYF